MFINTTGIILREVKYKDNSKMLTVLTSSEGKLSVAAHGAYRKNSKLASATDLLVFSHMTLNKKNDRWTLCEAQVIEQFLGLRDELQHLALGAYTAELTETIADEDSLNPELLPLCLNTLYALSEKIKSHRLIKPAFELRLMSIAGYEPILAEEPASVSSRDADTQAHMAHMEGTLQLMPQLLGAAKYILTCDMKKLFSLNIDEKLLAPFGFAVEEYLLAHLDKNFKTLDYYKKVLDL